MSRIVLERVSKRYPNGFTAARDLDLDIADGELLVLVGPSGSGKSTVLRMIAGLEPVSSGRIRIGDRDVTDLPPQARDLAMVFQSYALYPHMTVRDNLAFGLTVRKVARAEVHRRVEEVAESLGLTPLLARKPAQLSGGQRQRVALGRAIVREPRAFLFDEPLSNLDARLRVETRAELARLHQRLGATMVYVTHDQVEAMTLGTRVAVMREGTLQQVAPPMTLYREPANQFVAGFIGSPAMNFVSGAVRASGHAAVFEGEGLVLPIPMRTATPIPMRGWDAGKAGAGRGAGEADAGRGVVLGIRPHDLDLEVGSAPDTGNWGWAARVWLVEPLGSEQIVHLTAGGVRDLVAMVPPSRPVASGDRVTVRPRAGGLHLFDAASGLRLPPAHAPVAGG